MSGNFSQPAWTPEDDARLMALDNKGLSSVEIRDRNIFPGRTAGAIASRLSLLRLGKVRRVERATIWSQDLTNKLRSLFISGKGVADIRKVPPFDEMTRNQIISKLRQQFGTARHSAIDNSFSSKKIGKATNAKRKETLDPKLIKPPTFKKTPGGGVVLALRQKAKRKPGAQTVEIPKDLEAVAKNPRHLLDIESPYSACMFVIGEPAANMRCCNPRDFSAPWHVCKQHAAAMRDPQQDRPREHINPWPRA